MIDDGGNAFPCLDSNDEGSPGLSTRDYFAAAALSSLAIGELSIHDTAGLSFEMADAMIHYSKLPSPFKPK